MDMPMEQPSQEQEDPQDDSIMVNMSSLGDMAKDLKVGDPVTLKVSAIEGDMVQLTPDESEDEDPSTMPMDKLEASLPKAPERE